MSHAPREYIDRGGVIRFRTKCLERQHAESFAAALRANGRFHCVDVRESVQAPGRCFVQFLPKNPDRLADMTERQQAQRTARAATEGDAYTFWRDPDDRSIVWCQSASGETYELTVTGRQVLACTCPDWMYRGSRAGIRCKHIAAAAERIERRRAAA